MSRAASAFTLIEVLISITLAMLMAVLASTTFLTVRATVNRTESRLAMYAAAQTLYTHLHRQFLSTQNSCAFVVTTTQKNTAEDSTNPGTVRLIFMNGKEDTKDFDWAADKLGDSDLLWNEWIWRRGRKTLYSAANQPMRWYKTGAFEVGGVAGFAPGGLNYSGRPFVAVPQPRRWLDPSRPAVTLDDNIYFPSSSAVPASEAALPATSAANTDDIGDFTDLQRRLAPTLAQMTEFSVQLVAHDGTVTTFDDNANATDVRQGVWTDGRLTQASDTTAPYTAPAATFADSTVAKRPKIVRLRFTLEDRKVKLTQQFTFSFALPGMLPAP